MLQTLLQSELAKAPEVNLGLRDYRRRINALGDIADDAGLLEAATLLYVNPPGVSSTHINIRNVYSGVIKALPMIKVFEEDFI